MGFIGLHFPEANGGSGLGAFENVLVAESFCRLDSSLGSALMLSTFGAECLVRWADEDLKSRYLPELSTGEKILGTAFKEIGKGYDMTILDTRAQASENGSGWYLNGSKSHVVNGGMASIYLVLAKEDNLKTPSLFAIEADSESMSFQPLGRKVGVNMIPLADVTFSNTRIPGANRIGSPGQGDKLVQLFFIESRILVAAMALGMAQGAFDRAVAYVNARVQFGRKIGDFQITRHKLANMALAIEQARFVTYRAALACDSNKKTNHLPQFSQMAKLSATRAAVMVTDEALQLHGGYGYMTEYGIERFYRDAKAMSLIEGAGTLMQDEIGNQLIGRR